MDSNRKITKKFTKKFDSKVINRQYFIKRLGFNLAQLWKIDENGKLVNKNVTNWKYRDKNCTIPGEGQESYIEIHGLDQVQVMELRNGLSANGTEVDFQVTNEVNF